MREPDKDTRSESFRYFLLITILPIIGIIVIFLYALLYVQKDIDFISKEVNGLKAIKQINETIFNLQRIRGLTCITAPNQETISNIETVDMQISGDLASLHELIASDYNDLSVKNDMLLFTESIQKNTDDLAQMGFYGISDIIYQFMSYSKHIAYDYKLILDPEVASYILMDNTTILLPTLIEHNGRIRAIAVGVEKGALSSEQKQNIAIELSKIEKETDDLEYNMSLLKKHLDNEDMILIHSQVIKTQREIIDFVQSSLLNSQIIFIKPDGMFRLTTNYLDKLIELYRKSTLLLELHLKQRLIENERLFVYIILSAIASILFIIYINKVFYYKNNAFIKKIEELTVTDSMTSLYNRRHFDKVFENYVRVRQRANQTPVFIILDIDFFKEYNDTYGHEAGDKALIAVAKTIKSSLRRAGDMAFRLGGEEFGILYAEEDEEHALVFAKNILSKIENKKILHAKNSSSSYLTVSMGVFIINSTPPPEKSNIYRCADKALYKAKEQGRNRLVIYNTKTCCEDCQNQQ